MMKAMQNRALEEKKRIDLMDTINDIQDINKKKMLLLIKTILLTLYIIKILTPMIIVMTPIMKMIMILNVRIKKIVLHLKNLEQENE